MTNREKYAEQILDIALAGGSVAVDKKGNICRCTDIGCNNCIFAKTKTDDKCSCEKRIKEWSEQEYVDTAVDWSKVPVDTKILVRDSEDGRWEKRHFARYKNNIVFAWDRGCTSYSADGYHNVSTWKYAKLAEEDV